MNNEFNIGSLAYLISFYEGQITYFTKLGMNCKTNNGVTVTPNLLKTTTKRLGQLLDRKVQTHKTPINKIRWSIRRDRVNEIYELWRKYTKSIQTSKQKYIESILETDSDGGYDR